MSCSRPELLGMSGSGQGVMVEELDWARVLLFDSWGGTGANGRRAEMRRLGNGFAQG